MQEERPAFQVYKRPALQVYKGSAFWYTIGKPSRYARGQPSTYTKGLSTRCKVQEASLPGVQNDSLRGECSRCTSGQVVSLLKNLEKNAKCTVIVYEQKNFI
jgi:hypothetical protein